jgi:hypothetical protein
LNFDLQEKITICMNGVILHSIMAFNLFTTSNFPECDEFLNRLTFYSKIQNFAIDEYVFHVSICISSILK